MTDLTTVVYTALIVFGIIGLTEVAITWYDIRGRDKTDDDIQEQWCSETKKGERTMSVWGNPEIVKVDGEYKAYVKVQNDWSGDVRGRLRDIHMDKDGRYYCRADGRWCDVTRARERYIKQEQDIESAVKYAKEHRGF